MNGPDTEDNIVLLCAGCHYAVERLYDDAFYWQLSESLRLDFSLIKRGRKLRDGGEPAKLKEEPTDIPESPISSKWFRQLDARSSLLYLYRLLEQGDIAEDYLSSQLQSVYWNYTINNPIENEDLSEDDPRYRPPRDDNDEDDNDGPPTLRSI